MSVIHAMEEILPELTRNERKAAEYIISHPIDVIRYGSSDALGNLCGCSRNSIIRLNQKMGYKGFSEFKVALAKELNTCSAAGSASLSGKYINALEQMKPLEQSAILQRAARILKNADKIYSYGYSHSEYSARQFMFRMIRNGFPVQTISNCLGINEYRHLITNRDVLVIFSISGGQSSKSHAQSIEDIYRNGHPNIILFTMSDATPMEKFADVTIRLPCVSRMNPDAMIDDAPVFYVGIELLMQVLIQDDLK